MDCLHRSRKFGGGGPVGLVLGLGLLDGPAQVFEDGGQVGLELPLRLPELLDLRELVVEEAADEAVKVAGAGHVGPHRLLAVLDQDGGQGVLEEDVVARVAAVELARDFGVQVVVGVLGLPVAPRHAQRVLHRAVGYDAGEDAQLGHQRQLLPVIAAVGGQAALERGPDVQLAVGAAVLDQLPLGRVVVLDVWVVRHDGRCYSVLALTIIGPINIVDNVRDALWVAPGAVAGTSGQSHLAYTRLCT